MPYQLKILHNHKHNVLYNNVPKEELLSCMRPYKNLSPFQYSKGLILILLLRLTPASQDVPHPTEIKSLKNDIQTE